MPLRAIVEFLTILGGMVMMLPIAISAVIEKHAEAQST
jgi:hypothetical protein